MVKQKRRQLRGLMVNWSAHTKHILPFNISNTTQVKTKVLKAPINKGKGTWACRRGLIPGITRRHPSAQGTYQ